MVRRLQFAGGRLFKVGGARPEYMSRRDLIALVREMGSNLNKINEIVYANPNLSQESYFKIRFLATMQDEFGLATDQKPVGVSTFNEEGFELRTYRVVYVFRMGWIGDSEGRTWAKELYAECRFPTMEQAELHRQSHPDAFQDPRGQWRTVYDNGQIDIFTEHELVP